MPTINSDTESNDKKNIIHDSISLMYPAVDEKKRSIPRNWSLKDKYDLLALSNNNLTVKHNGFGKSSNDAASVRTSCPIPSECGIFYYEIKVLDKGHDGYIGIGVSVEAYNNNRLPGWEQDSIGYHGDDGNLFHSSGTGQSFGPTFTSGDIVGCGVNFFERHVFFTKNGYIAGFTKMDNQIVFYPTVGLRTQGEMIDTNFGQQPFVFDFNYYLKKKRMNLTETIEKRLSICDETENIKKINEMVMDYYIYCGNYESAYNFAVKFGLTISQPVNIIKSRKEIIRLITNNHIDDVIDMINQLFPHFFKHKPNIDLHLKCQQFIGLIITMHRATNQSCDDDTYYLNNILQLGKQIRLMANSFLSDINLNSKIRESIETKLKNMFSLICFKNPYDSPFNHLLESRNLNTLAFDVNDAILEYLGYNNVPSLKLFYQKIIDSSQMVGRHTYGSILLGNNMDFSPFHEQYIKNLFIIPNNQ